MRTAAAAHPRRFAAAVTAIAPTLASGNGTVTAATFTTSATRRLLSAAAAAFAALFAANMHRHRQRDVRLPRRGLRDHLCRRGERFERVVPCGLHVHRGAGRGDAHAYAHTGLEALFQLLHPAAAASTIAPTLASGNGAVTAATLAATATSATRRLLSAAAAAFGHTDADADAVALVQRLLLTTTDGTDGTRSVAGVQDRGPVLQLHRR